MAALAARLGPLLAGGKGKDGGSTLKGIGDIIGGVGEGIGGLTSGIGDIITATKKTPLEMLTAQLIRERKDMLKQHRKSKKKARKEYEKQRKELKKEKEKMIKELEKKEEKILETLEDEAKRTGDYSAVHKQIQHMEEPDLIQSHINEILGGQTIFDEDEDDEEAPGPLDIFRLLAGAGELNLASMDEEKPKKKKKTTTKKKKSTKTKKTDAAPSQKTLLKIKKKLDKGESLTPEEMEILNSLPEVE